MGKNDLPNPEVNGLDDVEDGTVEELTAESLPEGSDPVVVKAFTDLVASAQRKDAAQSKALETFAKAATLYKRAAAILTVAVLILVAGFIYGGRTLNSIDGTVSQTNARGAITLPLILCSAKTSNAVASDIHFLVLKDPNIKHYPIPKNCKIPTLAQVSSLLPNAK